MDNHKHLEIPKDFYSDSNDQPFKSCRVCECDLSDGKTPYSIEKAFKRVDEDKDITLFEIAICIQCAEKQSQKMSKESREYMMRVMEENRFMQKRMHLWESDWEESWKNHCLFSKEEVKLNDEYHIVGHFVGNKLINNLPPFVMGQSFIEEIQENLSAETKEEMDNFGQQFLGPDPSIEALLRDYQFVMI